MDGFPGQKGDRGFPGEIGEVGPTVKGEKGTNKNSLTITVGSFNTKLIICCQSKVCLDCTESMVVKVHSVFLARKETKVYQDYQEVQVKYKHLEYSFNIIFVFNLDLRMTTMIRSSFIDNNETVCSFRYQRSSRTTWYERR